MLVRRVMGLLGGGALLLVTSLSRAQCSKDTDCKGQRVCEAGSCVAPATSLPEAPPAPQGALPPADAGAPPVAAGDGRAPTALPAPSASAAPTAEPAPRMERHSKGMMAGGIVMVSLAPVALLVAAVSGLGKGLCSVDRPDNAFDQCDGYDPAIYGSLVSAVVLVGVGIPLIVIGAKKEPVDDGSRAAALSPWVTPTAAGLGLRIEL